ncbi:MurR/RpiR family transcriptional regulator [Kocuria sp. TGY1127_2]|uniref:MurR/RpiR family transcriptional regulator n=1 Tax=Kocuria sp. TGY1127_2 TaxID=2711328 RepID=UPI0015C1574B|nr:MurR/RpiR family transcriptional regulator [Kocuria sp. TGY1127_2]
MKKNVKKNSERASPPDVLGSLRALADTLSPGPAKVARFILDDPVRTVPMTLGELARSSRTSDASVIRLARSIGCAGYREMRTLLATSVGRAQGAAADQWSYPVGISAEDAPGDVVTKLAAGEREAISQTERALDAEAVRTVADAVANARRVLVVGIGASGLVAQDLAAKLGRIGLSVHAATEAHDALTFAVLLTSEDVFIGVSASGRTRDVVDPLGLAAQAGARTVGITTQPRAPLGSADHVLVSVASRESGIRLGAMTSRSGQLFVVDALFTMVFQVREEEARRAIARSHEALAFKRSPRPNGTTPQENRNS